MLAADHTYPATYVPDVLDSLEDGRDLVRGSRLQGQVELGAMSRFSLVGNDLVAFVAQILYGAETSDLCSGFWGLSRGGIESLKLDSVSFELEASMVADMAKTRYRLVEVPLRHGRRPTPVNHDPFMIGLGIGGTLIRKSFR